MTRAFNIEGLVRLQNYMGGKTLSDAQFFAVLNADVVEMPISEDGTRSRFYRQSESDTSLTFVNTNPSWIDYILVNKNTKMVTFYSNNFLTGRAGSITTEMLADGVVTSDKLANASVVAQKIAGGTIGSEKLAAGAIITAKIANGAVTSEKLAAGLDVSGLFFILPEGTQFPYTLTEEDKTKLANAKFLVCVSRSGSIMVLSHPVTSSYVGPWFGLYSTSMLSYSNVSESAINGPSTITIVDSTSVRFSIAQTLTAEQKLQARTNIGAAEDPNTSGDPQATLEEPPIVDEEPIP